ncbi:MAG: hypothetical protein RIB58_04300 [Phycisphaerales bacterium]
MTRAANEDPGDFQGDTAKLVRWVEQRLQLRKGASPPWSENIQSWLASDPQGDDDAPPVLIGELVTRLSDPNYGGHTPGPFGLTKPGNRVNVDAAGGVTFQWEKSTDAYFYRIEVNADPQFIDPPAHKSNQIGSAVTLPAGTLNPGATFYWRVAAHNDTGVVDASNAPFRFST